MGLTIGETVLMIFLFSIGLVLVVAKFIGLFDRPKIEPFFLSAEEMIHSVRIDKVNRYREEHPCCTYCEHSMQGVFDGYCGARHKSFVHSDPEEMAKDCPLFLAKDYGEELRKNEQKT